MKRERNPRVVPVEHVGRVKDLSRELYTWWKKSENNSLYWKATVVVLDRMSLEIAEMRALAMTQYHKLSEQEWERQ